MKIPKKPENIDDIITNLDAYMKRFSEEEYKTGITYFSIPDDMHLICNEIKNLKLGSSINKDTIRFIQNTGKAVVALREIVESSIFEYLSKHNPYWQSEHELEANKLNEIRITLNDLYDKIYGAMVLLYPETSESEDE